MRTFKLGYLILAMMVLSAVVSCTPSTQVVASWQDASYRSGSLHRPLVLAVANSPTVRATLEDEFVRQLRGAGVDAMQSYRLLPQQPDLSRIAELKDTLTQAGRDSLLITHLVDVKHEAVYVAPTTEYYGYPAYYDRWGGYYAHSYGVVTSPGYVYETKTYVLETNLYDASTDKRVWTVVTESEQPTSLDSAIHDFVGVIMKDVEAKRLF
jgi:hypothetical protein